MTTSRSQGRHRGRPDGRPLRSVPVDGAGDAVRSAVLRLAARFEPAEARGVDAAFVVELAGHEPVTLHVRDGRCLVATGAADRPAARLSMTPATWLDLVDGRMDGITAFLAGRLQVAGDLNLAARFDTMFAVDGDDRRRVRTLATRSRGVHIESLVSGAGTPVVLLHGLGASKLSFLPTLEGVSDRFAVHALDLPGFGKSGKPLPTGRRYSMTWMADVVHGYLRANGLPAAHLVGNSMGARIAAEVALRHPDAVRSVVGLGAAVPFDESQRFRWLLRLTRPQWLGVAPVPLRPSWVEDLVRDLFDDPSRVSTDHYRAAAADVVAAARDRGYRLALLACTRHLLAERADGRHSFWARLEHLAVPSYWIFGDSDRMVDGRYAARVERHLRAGRVELWPGVGHVPQFEVPDRTNAALTGWFVRADGVARSAGPVRRPAAPRGRPRT